MLQNKTKQSLLFKVILVVSFFISLSCQKDDSFENAGGNANEVSEENKNTDINARSGRVTIVNDRLHFPSKEEFRTVLVEYIENKSYKELYDYMRPFYNQGFHSMRPPAIEGYYEEEVITQYEDRVENFKTKYGQNFYTDEEIYEKIDDTSLDIWDDVFAAFINADGEMQIGDKIFKFTDAGVFYAEESYYPEINSFLSQNNISDNLLIATDENVVETIIANFSGTPVNITGNVSCFVKGPRLPDGPEDDGGWGGNTGSESDQDMSGIDDFLLEQTPCHGSHSTIGQIFGQHRVCKDDYASRRRVRTEIFNHYINAPFDIAEYYQGVEVTHQNMCVQMYEAVKVNGV